MKWALTATLLWLLPSWAQEAAASHHFVELPVSKLSVVETSAEFALVESKDGASAVLVQVGDDLGSEGGTVTRISKGCLWLSSGTETLSLCVDAGASPRS